MKAWMGVCRRVDVRAWRSGGTKAWRRVYQRVDVRIWRSRGLEAWRRVCRRVDVRNMEAWRPRGAEVSRVE